MRHYNLLKLLWGIEIKDMQFWWTHGLSIIDNTWVQNPQSVELVDLNIKQQMNFSSFKIKILKIIVEKAFQLPQFCKRSLFQSNLYSSPTTNQDTVVEVVHRCQFSQISRSKKKVHLCILVRLQKSYLEQVTWNRMWNIF